jgi:N6-adenosine-specific RNA methylase IME4
MANSKDDAKTMQLVSFKGGLVTDTGFELPQNLTAKRWTEIGQQLGSMERAVGWWIGDWWNAGEKYKSRVDIVRSPEWKGPTYQTCRNYGSVAARFDLSSRSDKLPFSHFLEAAKLSPEQATDMLERARETTIATGAPPPVRQLRQEVKATKREAREVELAEKIQHASETLDNGKLYGVILADPPWRFEPYSRDTGMDRAAENHYPTMTLEQMMELEPPAADDCALFMWATSPMLLDAVDLMAEWGFDYKTNWVWVKPYPGTGYWNRSCHEILLLGIKGRVPAPAPGTQMDSVFEGATGEHSEKPPAAAELIEEMFPHAALLEMFAREQRLGWTSWGAESDREQIATDSVESGGAALFEDADEPADDERVA